MKRCLIIFAREPERGRVKTRLRECLSETQCLGLYRAFLKDTLKLAKGVRCDLRVLAYSSDNNPPRYLKRIGRNFKLYKQKGRDLGERIYNAFGFARSRKASQTVVIGSDSPALPHTFVEDAFNKLEKSDVVIGPSTDGGYYLIGLRCPAAGLFKDVSWGSGRVLAETIRNAKAGGKKVALLNKWYDVDNREGLMCLKRHLKRQKDRHSAAWTRKFLKI